jgi:ABC-type multidrug transport system ATPase subunit
MVEQRGGIEVRWDKLYFQVPGKTKGEMRTILDSVSGCAKPGEMLAIFGPSGSGKTSLLNLLANRTLPSQGSIRYNGMAASRILSKLTGYVQQESHLFEE